VPGDICGAPFEKVALVVSKDVPKDPQWTRTLAHTLLVGAAMQIRPRVPGAPSSCASSCNCGQPDVMGTCDANPNGARQCCFCKCDADWDGESADWDGTATRVCVLSGAGKAVRRV
jgi:hypothetical protein